MTGRERLLKVLHGEIPDCVPVTPDISNMIPCKLTGLPFWDIYLYKKIPIWRAYIKAAKHYDIDAFADGNVRIDFDDVKLETDDAPHEWQTVIVRRDDTQIVTRSYYRENGKEIWAKTADVFRVADSPAWDVPLDRLHMSEDAPKSYEPIEGVCTYPTGEALLKLAKAEMGDQGLIGVTCGTTALISSEKDLYSYYDDPDIWYEKRDRLIDYYDRKFRKLMSLETKPDFLCVGASGSLIFQSPEIFREISFPIAKHAIELATKFGIPTHVHCCGPEKQLIDIMVNETSLTVIDPLEIPPMGNCVLKELKKEYGDRIVLKGNLHTTDVMLRGSRKTVEQAAKAAIDDAAKGGRFILSTGDQCGRDTPPENLRTMVEVARTYGKYE